MKVFALLIGFYIYAQTVGFENIVNASDTVETIKTHKTLIADASNTGKL